MARKRETKDTSDRSNMIPPQDLTNNQQQPQWSLVLHDTFREQLAALGLGIREMPGDGNCLFRALCDQMEGTCRNHLKHRHEVTQYMLHNAPDFQPFIPDHTPFQRYIRLLRQPGTYAGNDVIVAFARLHQVDVVIHQMNSPPWVIRGGAGGRQVHVSYSNGDHYSSIRPIGDNSNQPANIKLKSMYICENGGVAKQPGDKLDPEVEERLREEPEMESLIECVTAATDCKDRVLIRDTLLSCDNDIEKCIEAVMTLLYNQLDDVATDGASGTQQSKSGTRPKINSPKMSGKAERKLNKRERATLRHQEKLNNAKQFVETPPIDEGATVVQSMSSLQI